MSKIRFDNNCFIIPAKDPWKDLFFKEAFFLYNNREKIYSDIRMFLTPLPFENNLAYTGRSGLQDATLGIYLKWWDECEQAVIKDGDEVTALTYFIAGSPLSGSNRCSAVTKDGKTYSFQFSCPFRDIWAPFMRINQSYTETKSLYPAYTLEETIEILRAGLVNLD